MDRDETYIAYEQGSDEIINKLTEDHLGWAKSIAKAVARAWNLDWQLDGLDGGAYEGLLFCARRYDPKQGVPFRAYARRRIHEAATEEARKSKSWSRGVGAHNSAEQEAREISVSLFNIFPELREGLLPVDTEDSEDSMRTSIRQLLTGASLLAAFQESGTDNPEIATEYKNLVRVMASLDSVHQMLIWAVYWKDQSMRSLAEDWGVDDLSVIREHKEVLSYICAKLSNPRSTNTPRPKVRRGLRPVALKLKKSREQGPFSRFSALVILFAVSFLIANIGDYPGSGLRLQSGRMCLLDRASLDRTSFRS